MNKFYQNISKATAGLILLLLLGFLGVFSQNAKLDEKRVVLDDVKVNGISLTISQLSSIAITTNDSLTVLYHCDAKKEEHVAFIFKIIIKNEKEESFYTTNNTSVGFKNIPESNYEIRIEAFAPQTKWKASPISIKFIVDAQQGAEFVKKLKHKDSLNLRGKDTRTSNQQDSLKSKNPLDILNIYYYIFGLIILILIILLILLYKRKKGKKNNAAATKQKSSEIKQISNNIIIRNVEMPDENSITLSKSQLERLQVENSNLKAEIAALRGQIDSMQYRTKELYNQNKDLKTSIDKLAKSKHELEDLQSQKDDLFAVVIHDIKNPAALIKSLVELLRCYDLTTTEQQDVINDIFETTKKIVSLSQEVTRILSLESTSIKLNYDKVDIRDVIKDVAKRNTIAANAKSINLIVDIGENMPDIYIDYQKIDEVLDNLLSNAIKFSHSGGKVRVLSKIQEDNVIVEVSDNGLGLSEEDITQAFQRGVKLSAQPTGGEHSSGFGLWIVKKLIEAHKGRVWVKSALGKGSTFAFSIPMMFELSDTIE